MAPQVKLVYFDARGRAELLRLILHQSGVKFEDVRIAFADWPTTKPKLPFDAVPYLEIDGKAFNESLCLARFAARRHGLIGKTDIDALHADQVLAQTDDLRQRMIRIKFDSVCTEDQKKELKKKFEEEQLPAYLDKMNKQLEANKSGFFVGDALTMAELAVYDITENPVKENPKVLDKYPKIAAMRKMVESLPNLKDYLKNRKDTPM
ncbi:glutathione S-transferase [Elysia marginata]|uniref:Glutathione S-transferase n=1 Tax=Elysia marginata TaxID=1093978 RepID=A0AAV4JVW3_9GAST|nr:glutathione S-transferase [Elysia marginata]